MFSVPGGTSRAVVHWSDSATGMEVLHDLEPRLPKLASDSGGCSRRLEKAGRMHKSLGPLGPGLFALIWRALLKQVTWRRREATRPSEGAKLLSTRALPSDLKRGKTLRTLFELSRETFFPKSRRFFVDSLLRQTVFLHCLIAMYGGLGLKAERLIWAPFSHRLASLPRLLDL